MKVLVHQPSKDDIMFDFLYQMPNSELLFLLTCVTVIISFIAIILVKRYIPITFRYKDNSAIGDTSALISVIYAVLAGLAALYLINNINYTSDAVQREANAAADVYRDSRWLKNPTKSEIQAQVKQYLNHVINVEWPLMERGETINHDGDFILDNMTRYLSAYNASNSAELFTVRDILEQIRLLYNARHQRIQMSTYSLNPELWIVIIIGTVLTLFVNYLFGMNIYLHMFTVFAAALMTSSMIFLLISLDRPFQGESIIEYTPMQEVLVFIKDNAAQHLNGT
ncbi:MAG: DUF4239 domain-containing protein [Gammaproteobacteria bacterium]|nr:MAG: DUF4239 domain-containing protein [Gammaproteobacteria bacterium]